MNIIRTAAVELSSIPAIAYKMKLSSGGAGIKLFRLDNEATAVFTIDRRSGEGVAYGPTDESLFPSEAVDEAIELAEGLPYSSRGKFNVPQLVVEPEKEDVESTAKEGVDMVGSDEYKAIVDRYDDENGRLNYRVMNKEFIQFTSKSKTVNDMVAAGASVDEILVFIVKSRAAFFSGKKESLSDDQVEMLVETLDEMAPRSAFKELNDYLRKMKTRR